MPYLTDLDTALRNGGCAYRESPGWRQRGHGPLRGVRGILIHHTAGGGSSDWKTVQNGRPGLAGPLAQMTLERDGAVLLIAAGQCWHSGNGTHPGVGGAVGNGWLIGIEGVSRGVGNDWTAAQRREYPRVAAALCRHYRLPPSAVVGHKEYATPRGRKIDPGDWDMNQFRAEVARHLGGAPRQEEDIMASIDDLRRVVREEIHTVRLDVGHIRKQILSRLGVEDTEGAPHERTHEEAAAIDPARRVDVGHSLNEMHVDIQRALDQILAAVKVLGATTPGGETRGKEQS